MPIESVPFVTAVVCAFLLFILVLGGTAIWTVLPAPKMRHRGKAGHTDRLEDGRG
jgi:hypothetical protein